MTQKRRTFTQEFKKEAVELVVKQCYSTAQAASSLASNKYRYPVSPNLIAGCLQTSEPNLVWVSDIT